MCATKKKYARTTKKKANILNRYYILFSLFITGTRKCAWLCKTLNVDFINTPIELYAAENLTKFPQISIESNSPATAIYFVLSNQ